MFRYGEGGSIDIKIRENNSDFKQKYESILPIKYPLYCYGLNKKKTCVKNSLDLYPRGHI